VYGRLSRAYESEANARREVSWSVLSAFSWILGGFATAMLQLYLKV
jgi:hypothetical protein